MRLQNVIVRMAMAGWEDEHRVLVRRMILTSTIDVIVVLHKQRLGNLKASVEVRLRNLVLVIPYSATSISNSSLWKFEDYW